MNICIRWRATWMNFYFLLGILVHISYLVLGPLWKRHLCCLSNMCFPMLRNSPNRISFWGLSTCMFDRESSFSGKGKCIHLWFGYSMSRSIQMVAQFMYLNCITLSYVCCHRMYAPGLSSMEEGFSPQQISISGLCSSPCIYLAYHCRWEKKLHYPVRKWLADFSNY